MTIISTLCQANEDEDGNYALTPLASLSLSLLYFHFYFDGASETLRATRYMKLANFSSQLTTKSV